jgi:hypothetical protein
MATLKNCRTIVKADGIKKKKHSGNGAPPNGRTDDHLFEDKRLLSILTEVKNRNFRARMPMDLIGIHGKICDTLNEIISLNETMMIEFAHAGNTIGKQGKLTQRIELPSINGS